MFQSDDTICAISTPAGVGGIAVARISGPDAVTITDGIWRGKQLAHVTSHTAHFGEIIDPDSNEILDQTVATVFRAPHSFTGEDIVELSVHGSRWIQRELINLLIRRGCRLADAGEFTKRAFASGRIDLAEAEAVADVIASTSRASHRVAMSQLRGKFSLELETIRGQMLELASLLELELDFSEEDVEFADRRKLISLAENASRETTHLAGTFATGNALKTGIAVAIVGAPNAGKSTLLNRLLGDDKAIVSNIPGTTRDAIEDTLEIKGVQFRLIDTAGLRHTSDAIEKLGIQRTIAQIEKARIVIWVIDPSDSQESISKSGKEISQAMHRCADTALIMAINKSDLYPTTVQATTPGQSSTHTPAPTVPFLQTMEATFPGMKTYTVAISAATGQGISQLEDTIIQASGTEHWETETIVTNSRHYQALLRTHEALCRVIDGLHSDLPGDLIAQDLREAIHHLGEITGTITTPDILSTIFARFCIGK